MALPLNEYLVEYQIGLLLLLGVYRLMGASFIQHPSCLTLFTAPMDELSHVDALKATGCVSSVVWLVFHVVFIMAGTLSHCMGWETPMRAAQRHNRRIFRGAWWAVDRTYSTDKRIAP